MSNKDKNKIQTLRLTYMVLSRGDLDEPYEDCSDEQFKDLRDVLEDTLMNEWAESLEFAISLVFGG